MTQTHTNRLPNPQVNRKKHKLTAAAITGINTVKLKQMTKGVVTTSKTFSAKTTLDPRNKMGERKPS